MAVSACAGLCDEALEAEQRMLRPVADTNLENPVREVKSWLGRLGGEARWHQLGAMTHGRAAQPSTRCSAAKHHRET